MKNMVPKNTIINRFDGPASDPGTLRLRSTEANTNPRHSSIISTAKWRVNEPSTVCCIRVW